MKDKTVTLRADTATVIRVLLLVVATIFALSFLKSIVEPLIIILMAFFFALALNPAVSFIANKLKSGSRARATAVAYLIVLTLLIGFFALVIPPLVKQTADFIKEVPTLVEDFKNSDSNLSNAARKYEVDRQLDEFSSNFSDKFKDISKPVLSTAGAVGSTLATIIIVLVLTFMMLVEGPEWMKRFWAAQPVKDRARRKKLAHKMYKVVTGYVNGQVIISAIAGLFAAVTLFIASNILHAPVNAIALGGIVALFALLPLIGTTLGAAIVVLACLLVSLPLAIVMAIYFVIYQQIENVTIQPYIQARSNNLTPLIVFAAAIIGVEFGGILGAFLAIPAAGCLKVLLEDYYSASNSKSAKT